MPEDLSDWPKGKTIIPKAANEVKLISSGKILENNKTVGQCKLPFGENATGAIIMHVVVQPSLAKTKAEKKVDDSPKKIVCSCSIM
ncbi:Membrane-anchored ubiquitin-fold protein [Quillaja saponaria]|uniref:Membrane-anchored ubiquitin-fold protein n=1 Tax=Quillaja saponaria TaxID=32244 RepID=A0AAD7KTX0_QUISA|nr:Membrane-anchored ubiquitin-fold protein [Quillaja saponaria]